MRQVISFALFLFVLGCNNESKNAVGGADSIITDSVSNTYVETEPPPPPVDTEKWKLETDVAEKMIKYVKGCDLFCKNEINIIDPNSAVLAALFAKYPPPAMIIPVLARYKDKLEAENYCTVRGVGTGDDKCKLKKHQTIIYKVLIPATTPQAQPNYTKVYYDIVTICPPPEGGTCEVEVTADTTKKKK